ncbi:MAG: hypothetical protein R3281_11630 [Balneolaceae bacterium]|nr:hypothetical protein [Balneolaceae bacterium]
MTNSLTDQSLHAFLEIDGKPRRGAGPPDSSGNRKTDVAPGSKLPLDISQNWKQLKLVCIFDEIPVSPAGVEGVKLIPGSRLEVPHHVEFYNTKFRGNDSFAVLIHAHSDRKENLIHIDPEVHHPQDDAFS